MPNKMIDCKAHVQKENSNSFFNDDRKIQGFYSKNAHNGN